MINAQQLTNSASLSSDLTLESGLSSQSSPNRTVNDHIHSIIHRFDLSKPIKRNQIESNRSSLIFVTDQQTTTFRPSSAILYLHPPKPKHIESIETRFNGIELMNSKLIIKWSLNVKLRTANNQIESNDDDRNNMDQNNGQNNGTDDDDHDLPLSNRSKRNILNAAKIELEKQPIQFRIHLRRYGSKQRQRFSIIDRNNTLDPPKTDNQTYEYSIDRLDTSSAYEFCLQSVNAGQIYASEELNRKFPCDAQTDIAGRNNPLFLCKEIVFNDQSENHDRKEGRSQIADHQFNATNQTATTTATKKNSNRSGKSLIEMDDEAIEAFVLYTAISSGSTTILFLIIIAIFCCCRCRRKEDRHNYYYNHRMTPPSSHHHHHYPLVCRRAASGYDRVIFDPDHFITSNPSSSSIVDVDSQNRNHTRTNESINCSEQYHNIIVPFNGFRT